MCGPRSDSEGISEVISEVTDAKIGHICGILAVDFKVGWAIFRPK
jgi:hypothetical protein